MKPPFHEMSNNRFVHRLETASRNRDESLRIRVSRQLEHDAVRAEQENLRMREHTELSESWKRRRRRWQQKLLKSPLSVDLLSEDKERRSRLLRQSESLRSFSVEKEGLDSDIRDAALEATVADEPVEMGELRNLKRELLLQLRQLRAMRDVERTNSRIHEISCSRA